jgi:hypothetical protein
MTDLPKIPSTLKNKNGSDFHSEPPKPTSTCQIRYRAGVATATDVAAASARMRW